MVITTAIAIAAIAITATMLRSIDAPLLSDDAEGGVVD